MKQMALTEIADLDEGMPIPMVAGHVKMVFERKAGVGEFGEWSFQSAILTDGESEVNLKFKNMEDMASLQGKDVTIRSNKSAKHGLTGAVKVVENYQGKTFHKIQLTPSCKIVVGLGNGKADEPNAEDDFIPMTHDDKGAPLAGVDEAKHHLMKTVNFYNLCVDAVDAVVKPNVENMTAEMYQAAVSSVFIEGSRSGMISKMPVTKIK